MMPKAEVVLRSMEHMTTLNVRVRVAKEFRIRLWIATQCIRLAAWLLKANVNVDVENG